MNAIERLYRLQYGPVSKMANWEDFSRNLSESVGRPMPWSARYLRSVAKGDKGFYISDFLQRALDGFEPIDPQELFLDLSVTNNILSLHDIPPGTIIMGNVKKCGWCELLFVPMWPQTEYHDDECKRLARNKRARERYGASKRHKEQDSV